MHDMNERLRRLWREYDFAAKWCAIYGHRGQVGDPLPEGLSGEVCEEINADPEAFERRVRETAYMLACDPLRAQPRLGR